MLYAENINDFLWTFFVHINVICNFGQKLSLISTVKQKFTSFGEHLRTLREEITLPLREVASHIGIDPSLLAKIERNERQPTKQLIKQIAIYYNVNEKELQNEFLSDKIAYKIFDEDADLEILKVAEKKVSYLKNKHNEQHIS